MSTAALPNTPAPPATARRRLGVRDLYTAKVRLAALLVLFFVVLPGALLLTVGILLLVFEQRVHDIVFGVLTLSLAVVLIAGITFTFLYVRRATALARLQTSFVQKVSHDLRTPLTSIRMFAETLQSGRLKDPSRVKECLDLLSAESGRLEAMVERLLKWASMEAGKRAYLLTPQEPKELVRRALAAVETQVQLARLDGSVEVDCQVDDALPLVEADRDALVEALVNLLQNALHYTGKDKRLAVRVKALDHKVELGIKDNGPGIPKADQSRIFEKFYRVVNPSRPDVGGTGLGLAIVHHIVRAHGGKVSVESDLGQGATFRVLLPAVRHG